MTVVYGNLAFIIPLLSLLGIAIMLSAGVSKLVKWWIMRRYIQKIREVKGGKKNVKT